MALFGVYRGVVLDNSDPQVSGRVKVNVEGRHSWALVTMTSPKIQVGAMVIVAFERGDPDMPEALGFAFAGRTNASVPTRVSSKINNVRITRK
jgi:hypothetical protein